MSTCLKIKDENSVVLIDTETGEIKNKFRSVVNATDLEDKELEGQLSLFDIKDNEI